LRPVRPGVFLPCYWVGGGKNGTDESVPNLEWDVKQLGLPLRASWDYNWAGDTSADFTKAMTGEPWANSSSLTERVVLGRWAMRTWASRHYCCPSQ